MRREKKLISVTLYCRCGLCNVDLHVKCLDAHLTNNTWPCPEYKQRRRWRGGGWRFSPWCSYQNRIGHCRQSLSWCHQKSLFRLRAKTIYPRKRGLQYRKGFYVIEDHWFMFSFYIWKFKIQMSNPIVNFSCSFLWKMSAHKIIVWFVKVLIILNQVIKKIKYSNYN